jgi:hypothetical protein
LSQKSHKVAVLLGIILLSALSLPDRRKGGSGGSRCRRAVRALLGWFKGPLRSGVADAQFVPLNVAQEHCCATRQSPEKCEVMP